MDELFYPYSRLILRNKKEMELVIHTMAQLNLEISMLSEGSQIKKKEYTLHNSIHI